MSKIHGISVNGSQDMFTVATEDGVRVFETRQLHQLVHLKQPVVGSVRVAKILNSSVLIGMISGGMRPKHADNVVMIWNHERVARKFIWEYTSPERAINFQFSPTRMVVVEYCKIHLFALGQSVEFIKTIETGHNHLGLCELCQDPSWELLVYPGRQAGCVQFVNLRNVAPHTTLTPTTINAHRTDLQRIALNNLGTLLATGSSKGTVIRLFDTRTCELLREFRRGSDPATLQCLRFSPCSTFLGVASDKETIHVFVVKPHARWTNKKSVWSHVGLVGEEAHRACAQFTVPRAPQEISCTELAFIVDDDTDVDGQAKLSGMDSVSSSGSTSLSRGGASLRTNMLVVICDNGIYHLFTYSSDGTCDLMRDEYLLDWGDDEFFFKMCSQLFSDRIDPSSIACRQELLSKCNPTIEVKLIATKLKGPQQRFMCFIVSSFSCS